MRLSCYRIPARILHVVRAGEKYNLNRFSIHRLNHILFMIAFLGVVRQNQSMTSLNLETGDIQEAGE